MLQTTIPLKSSFSDAEFMILKLNESRLFDEDDFDAMGESVAQHMRLPASFVHVSQYSSKLFL